MGDYDALIFNVKLLIGTPTHAIIQQTANQPASQEQELLKSRQLATTISTTGKTSVQNYLFCYVPWFPCKIKNKERLIDNYCIIWLQNYEIYRDVL